MRPAKSGYNNTVLRRSALSKVKTALTRRQVLARISHVDPILQAVLGSNYDVSPSALLSLRPDPHWVSHDTLRYS